MQVDFILVASGSVMTRQLNVALMESFPEGAKIEAQRHVATLHKAGYSSFTLYDTRRENSNACDFQIATFRVAEQEPHILME